MKYRLLCAIIALASAGHAADKPNILWLSSEDNAPHLGCYGDKDANTPNLDKLATKSLRYTKCWSVAPVCAPSRTTIIMGMYPSSLGAEHMRSLVKIPKGMQLLPQLVRAAGYYCTNNSKEDYNVQPHGLPWDESSPKAHYNKRPAGSPFFAVFNFTDTHESGTRKRPHEFVHDPEKITVPPQHPDLPEVRKSWAQVHDKMTIMDRLVGKKLDELNAEGLAEDTIIFYFGDHGTGLPRFKRFPGNSGLQVPLIVHFPDKWKHLAPTDYANGAASDRLVSFVDLAPTVLAILGVEIPKNMQGTPFAGKNAPKGRQYNHGLRGRMDERYDLARSVTDGRYVYIKNYYPDLPWGQHVSYMFITPSTKEWHAAFTSNKLKPEHNTFWLPKGPEELYDLTTDPGELKNLANDAAHAPRLEELRKAQRDHAISINDVAMMPELELLASADDGAPAEVKMDIPNILTMANLATNGSKEATPELLKALTSKNATIRYWATTGLRLRGSKDTILRELMTTDPSLSVKLAAAAALAHHGDQPAVEFLLARANLATNDFYAVVAALNYLDNLPKPILEKHLDVIKTLPTKVANAPKRGADSPQRLIKRMLGQSIEE